MKHFEIHSPKSKEISCSVVDTHIIALLFLFVQLFDFLIQPFDLFSLFISFSLTLEPLHFTQFDQISQTQTINIKFNRKKRIRKRFITFGYNHLLSFEKYGIDETWYFRSCLCTNGRNIDKIIQSRNFIVNDD